MDSTDCRFSTRISLLVCNHWNAKEKIIKLLFSNYFIILLSYSMIIMSAKQFSLAAMGGTFDIIHAGHLALLNNAFSISSKVIIGLTGDEFAKKMGKNVSNNYSVRLESLKSKIMDIFPDSNFVISKLENDFGPAVLEEDVEALVVSEETKGKGKALNDLRIEKGLSEVDIIVVPMILAKDGNRISTTRIKKEEIDSNGNLS